jgi:acetate CoA/acetoacetate CoA-transferase alpha subunit
MDGLNRRNITMIDKTTTIEKALAYIHDGDTVMVGGFGVPGTPFILIEGLLNKGITDLILIKNEANEDGMGISKLIEAGRVRKLITSHLGLNATVIEMMNRRDIDVEFFPQGILAEKIRAAGAGLIGILTDIGIDTILREKKQIMTIDGRDVLVEKPLRADVALIHASIADRMGNLIFEQSAQNFNPIMAMAADRVITEVEKIVEIGELDPDSIHTPGAFVDHLIMIRELTYEYGILESHVL